MSGSKLYRQKFVPTIIALNELEFWCHLYEKDFLLRCFSKVIQAGKICGFFSEDSSDFLQKEVDSKMMSFISFCADGLFFYQILEECEKIVTKNEKFVAEKLFRIDCSDCNFLLLFVNAFEHD